MLRALTEDRAFYYCYESLQTFRTALPDPAHVLAEAPPPVAQRFSPNRVEFDYPGRDKPTRLYLNYNWSPGLDEHGGADRCRLEGRHGLRRDAAGPVGHIFVLVRATGVVRRPGDLRDRHRHFGGSATTIATASPLGDTLSRLMLPSLWAAPSNTSVQPAAPRVHEHTLVPADITSVLPSGIHA